MKQQDDTPKVWITVTEKINIGNYESLEIQAGYSKCYTKEDPKELINQGIDELQSIIEKKAKKIRKKRRRN